MKITSHFKFYASISAVILAVGIVMAFISGLNFGIDFTGGSIFTIDMKQDFDSNDVSNALAENGIIDAQVIKSGATADDKSQAVIRLKQFGTDQQENETRQKIVDGLREKYPNAEVGGVDRVGGVASADLVRNALLSVAIASLLMLCYIWMRFELHSGFAAIIALMHDVGIMLAVVIIFRMPINSSFIAAVLTIVGYSINNTIVVFDRVRENNARKVFKTIDELVDGSIKQSLTRSINTSLTTLITITMLYILGVDSIKEFALPIIVGLLAGTYSSVFLAAPLWQRLGKNSTQITRKRKAI